MNWENLEPLEFMQRLAAWRPVRDKSIALKDASGKSHRI
jgi:hypothetical protein